MSKEVTLDPENWDEMKALGHKMLEDMMEYLKTIRKQPYSTPTEQTMKAVLTPLPDKGEGEQQVYNLFKNHIIPHTFKWIKPDFWGYVIGTGSPFGMLTEMLVSGIASGTNPLMFINHQAIDWVKKLLEYPEEAGGVFVSGGSEANFTGLTVARNSKAEIDMKVNGMQGVTRKMTLYCSEETHACLDLSVELLGLGNDALRWIKTDDNCRIELNSLKNSIEADRKKGHHPFCVIGNAGTVNSGAFDDLNSLADLCEKEDLWFHIDGAFGSWVKLSTTHKHLADGLERSDSLAVDFHKWMNMPTTIGLALVKDRLAHFSTFVYGHDAEYIRTQMEEVGDAVDNIFYRSLALSRPDYGLKAYMLLRAYGRDKYSKLVQQNIDQINYLAELIKKEPNLEITAPVISNIVCFRYIQDGLSEKNIEELNRRIMNKLWEGNPWMISDTNIKGKYMLRACNVNHRSKYSDFNILVERITSIGDKLAKEYL
jgi:glutamate/tyrosine decarboxylase-like PLP-dependent enzyme